MPNKPETHTPRSINVRHKARTKPRATTKEQRDAVKLRSSIRWQKYRTWILDRFPMCMDPKCGKTKAATQVHHIIPLVVDKAQAYKWRNTIPLCTGCHGTASARERQGKGSITYGRWWE